MESQIFQSMTAIQDLSAFRKVCLQFQLRHFARGTGLKIVASGGVSSMEDLELLKTLEADGVDQVISGKAIYEGKLDLKEIFKC